MTHHPTPARAAPVSVAFLLACLPAPAEALESDPRPYTVVAPGAMFAIDLVSRAWVPPPQDREGAPAPGEPPSGARLQALFARGRAAQADGRWDEAEACLLSVLAAEPRDWEARVALAQVYQAAGRLARRDSALDRLRRMHAEGRAWASGFVREEFPVAGRTVRAVESPSLTFPHRRRIEFHVREEGSGTFRHLAAVRVQEERAMPVPAGPGKPSAPRRFLPGFRILFAAEGLRREYFIPYHRPRYAVLRAMASNFLTGRGSSPNRIPPPP